MTPQTTTKPLFVRLASATTGEWFVDPMLREHLVKDAEEKGSNLTDVAVEILSKSCKVPFVPTGRKTKPSPSQHELNLGRVSIQLFRTLSVYGTSGSAQDAARMILSRHYGLRAKPPVRRGRRPRAAAA